MRQWVEETPPVQAEMVQVARDSPATDRDVLAVEFEGDAGSGVLALTTHRLDRGDDLRSGRGGLVRRC